MEKGYKQTEIGVIPVDWEAVKIESIIKSTQLGGNYSNDEVENEFPLIKMGNLSRGKIKLDKIQYISKGKPNETDLLKFGDVLFNTRNTLDLVGKVAIWRGELSSAYFNSNIMRFNFNDNISSSLWVNLILNTPNFITQLRGIAIGTTSVAAIYNRDLFKLKIPLPSLPEQTAIANALSDMDALIAQTEKLIEKKKAIKQGVMQELLKPKEGWVTKKLGEVCEIIMGQSPLSEYYNFTGIGLPLIQGNADIKNRKTITRTYSSNITKKGKLGDIIMTVRAPVGEIAISSFECCLGRGVCALRYENDFMYHYLISMENYWSRLSSGSTFDSVNSSQIRDLPITLPGTKKEQIEIAKTLTDLDKDIELTETKLQKLKHQKQGMMQALHTGKIRLI
ncbi:MAG: restriction endonuclease subunit S [Bacteroidia bacterium]|nr:restriction endonuclease subunit S [Bacteroidia bacterium]